MPNPLPAALPDAAPGQALRRDARIAAGIFLLAFVAFAYFYGGNGWNQDAHFDLTRALVERGTLYIDGYEANTGDVSRGADGRVYINKAPGASFLAAPPYAAVRAVESLLGIQLDAETSRTNAWIVTTLTCGLSGAALATVLFLFARRRTEASAVEAIALALAIAFGTIVFPYATMLMAHVPAALFLLLAFVLVHERPLLAGAAAGIAATCFYVAALGAVALAVVAATRGSRAVLRFLAGGAPFALLLGLYHRAAFGSPFRTAVETSEPFTERGLLFGVLRTPRLEALADISVSPYRGLFFASPVLLFGVAGIVMMIRRRATRAMGLAILATVAGFFAVIASFNGWSGGWAFGPRYLLPIVPLLGIAMLHMPGRRASPMRVLWIASAVLSFAIHFIATSTDAMPSPELRDPLRAYLVPAFFTGEISEETRAAFPWYGSTRVGKVALPGGARNAGERIFGEGRRTSVAPVFFWIVAGTALLLREARRADEPEKVRPSRHGSPS